MSTYKKVAPLPGDEITYLGKDTLTSILDPDSGSVTIPANADAIIVFAVGHQTFKSGPAFFDSLNFDDGGTLDFTHIGTALVNVAVTCGMFIMTAASSDWPGSGAKTIYWSGPANDDNYDSGMSMVVSYWSGMAQVDPIRDTEVVDLPDITETKESSLTGVIATDMSVGVAWAYQQTPDPAPAGYGQTAIEESFFNKFGIGVHYEMGEDVLRFENLKAGDGGIVWAAIKAA